MLLRRVFVIFVSSGQRTTPPLVARKRHTYIGGTREGAGLGTGTGTKGEMYIYPAADPRRQGGGGLEPFQIFP